MIKNIYKILGISLALLTVLLPSFLEAGTSDTVAVKVTITPAVASKYLWAVVDEHDTPLPSQADPRWFYNATGGDRGSLNDPDTSYSWDSNSTYTATINHKNPGALWTYGGMWYSLIRVDSDNTPLNFRKIFGPYIKPEYQGEVTELAIVVNSVSSTSANGSLDLKVELKNEAGTVIREHAFGDLISQTYPRTFTLNVNTADIQNIETIIWLLDHAQVGDSISIDKVLLRTRVLDMPAREEAFLWAYSWLMANYDPSSGMVQDRSNFKMADMENVTATAKVAKLTYYAYKKGLITYSNAAAIITKIADAMINKIPRGPSGVNTLWTHFTKNGGTAVCTGSEWASGDTCYAALDIIAALKMIGDPQNQITSLENYLKGINWNDLLIAGDFISHGYSSTGVKISSAWQGFGMETIGVNWAYASATGEAASMLAPPSDNGSGFIDNACYPIVFSGTDGWGNDWDAYRNSMADTQIGWYANPTHFNQYFNDGNLFGLSAGESPDRSQYLAYGTGGKGTPETGGGEDIVLHYSGMIADIKPNEAIAMWETLRDRSAAFLTNRVIISPLNNMESMKVNKTTGKLTVNHLKGSWNMALQAEGWAMMDDPIRTDLENAIQNNAFLKSGYDILKESHDVPNSLRVPQDYPTIQAAINAAVSGDTIQVSSGTYNEQLTVNKSGITIQGASRASMIYTDGASPVISCENITGAETVITGFEIRRASGANGIVCAGTVDSLRIEDNLFSATTISGIAITLQSGASAVIKNNILNDCTPIYCMGNNSVEITGNTIKNTLGPNPPGIYLINTTGLVKSNWLRQRWDGAINISGNSNINLIGNHLDNCYGWTQTPGIKVTDSTIIMHNNIISNCVMHSSSVAGLGVDASNSSVFVYNNVFYGNSGQASLTRGVAIKASNTNLVVKNNIFQGNTGGLETVYFDGSGTQDFSYNDMWSNTTTSNTTGVTMGSGNKNVDPLFISFEHGGFKLGAGSQCINAGDPGSEYNDKDGTRNDMGAYGGINTP